MVLDLLQCFSNGPMHTASIFVAGLPPRSGGVARALGPRRWTNNSTGLLDMK